MFSTFTTTILSIVSWRALIIWLTMSHTIGTSVPLHTLASEAQPPSYIDNNNIYNIKQTMPK